MRSIPTIIYSSLLTLNHALNSVRGHFLEKLLLKSKQSNQHYFNLGIETQPRHLGITQNYLMDFKNQRSHLELYILLIYWLEFYITPVSV